MEDEGHPSSAASSERLHLHTRTEVQDLVAHLLKQAKRRICVFAPMLPPDLFNSVQNAKALAHFAATHRSNRALFLVEDGEKSVQHNGRVVEMCRRLSDFIEMRRIVEEEIGLQQLWVIVDDSSYLHQRHLDKQDYIARFEAKSEARSLLDQFERLWERSQPIHEIHPLGL
ncbi:MAG: hypothetical protein ACE5K1_04180 [Acidiferrobacterales bacterium]